MQDSRVSDIVDEFSSCNKSGIHAKSLQYKDFKEYILQSRESQGAPTFKFASELR